MNALVIDLLPNWSDKVPPSGARLVANPRKQRTVMGHCLSRLFSPASHKRLNPDSAAGKNVHRHSRTGPWAQYTSRSLRHFHMPPPRRIRLPEPVIEIAILHVLDDGAFLVNERDFEKRRRMKRAEHHLLAGNRRLQIFDAIRHVRPMPEFPQSQLLRRHIGEILGPNVLDAMGMHSQIGDPGSLSGTRASPGCGSVVMMPMWSKAFFMVAFPRDCTLYILCPCFTPRGTDGGAVPLPTPCERETKTE